jgi:hypothetical protein
VSLSAWSSALPTLWSAKRTGKSLDIAIGQ